MSSESWVIFGLLCVAVIGIAYCLTLLESGGGDDDSGRHGLP